MQVESQVYIRFCRFSRILSYRLIAFSLYICTLKIALVESRPSSKSNLSLSLTYSTFTLHRNIGKRIAFRFIKITRTKCDRSYFKYFIRKLPTELTAYMYISTRKFRLNLTYWISNFCLILLGMNFVLL